MICTAVSGTLANAASASRNLSTLFVVSSSVCPPSTKLTLPSVSTPRTASGSTRSSALDAQSITVPRKRWVRRVHSRFAFGSVIGGDSTVGAGVHLRLGRGGERIPATCP